MDITNSIVPQTDLSVNTLPDAPILVVSSGRAYWLDITTDDPMEETDIIPFEGEPAYGDEPLTEADTYGLEPREVF